MRKTLLGLVALLVLAGCEFEAEAKRDDPVVLPKIEGCTIERHVVRPKKNATEESLYIARCAPSKTTSVTTQYGCGKHCTKKVTTITTIEGTPEEEQR